MSNIECGFISRQTAADLGTLVICCWATDRMVVPFDPEGLTVIIDIIKEKKMEKPQVM
jgi:hypothetical protein